MSNSFGTDFILINDVRQPLNTKVFGPNWIHIATIKRGFDEFVCFANKINDKCYIEKIDIHDKNIFKRIEEDSLWVDLVLFLRDRGLLRREEFKTFKINV